MRILIPYLAGLLAGESCEVIYARRFSFALDCCWFVSDGWGSVGGGQLRSQYDSARGAAQGQGGYGRQDTIHGHKIADPYRWLEDANSPDSQEYVRAEMAYTRSLLDPLPGRDRIHERLTQLLSIGTIGTPQIGGPYFFYTRREGTQNQPVLLVREGLGWKRPGAGGRQPDVRRRHGRAGLVVPF